MKKFFLKIIVSIIYPFYWFAEISDPLIIWRASMCIEEKPIMKFSEIWQN